MILIMIPDEIIAFHSFLYFNAKDTVHEHQTKHYSFACPFFGGKIRTPSYGTPESALVLPTAVDTHDPPTTKSI